MRTQRKEAGPRRRRLSAPRCNGGWCVGRHLLGVRSWSWPVSRRRLCCVDPLGLAAERLLAAERPETSAFA